MVATLLKALALVMALIAPILAFFSLLRFSDFWLPLLFGGWTAALFVAAIAVALDLLASINRRLEFLERAATADNKVPPKRPGGWFSRRRQETERADPSLLPVLHLKQSGE